MNRETVKYNYGVTVTGNIRVMFECVSSAVFVKIATVSSVASFVLM